MGLNKVKLRRGLAGLVAGLIAAIALLAIALPVMMQYQQHITKSYHIKEYATMLEKQKEIEEKGLASCFNKEEGVISINNTLGTPVRIVMVYATDGNQSQKYFNASGYVIKPGINRVKLSELGINITSPENIKTIKLVTSRGTVIQPPYCREIVKIVTYEQVIEYIIKKIQRSPITVFFDENQTKGITPTYLGRLVTNGAIEIFKKSDADVYLVNGTTTSTIRQGVPFLLNLTPTVCDCDISLAGIYVHTVSFYTFNDLTYFTLKRCEAGDYVAYVVDVLDTEDLEIASGYGCSNVNEYCDSCKLFSIPKLEDVFGGYKARYSIKVLALNYVSKIPDTIRNYPNGTGSDPLRYILVNSGYRELIVGFEGETEKSRIVYNAYIFVSKKEIPISGSLEAILNKLSANADIKIEIIGDNAQAFYRGTSRAVPLIYRAYLKFSILGWSDVMHDQKVVVLSEDILSEVGIEPGDKVYVYVVAWYEKNNNKFFDYSDNPAVYVYTPIKAVVDRWYSKYIGG